MLIPVTGSVQKEEPAVDVVEVVVVHVMAVLVGAVYLWHEIRPNRPTINARTGRRLTAPLSLISQPTIHFG
jgi:hypothetical protein